MDGVTAKWGTGGHGISRWAFRGLPEQGVPLLLLSDGPAGDDGVVAWKERRIPRLIYSSPQGNTYLVPPPPSSTPRLPRMKASLAVHKFPMILIPIAIQQGQHRSRPVHRRLRPFLPRVVRSEITLREARAVGEELEVVLAVARDPRPREHVERGFGHEVRVGPGAEGPAAEVEHVGYRAAAGGDVDDARGCRGEEEERVEVGEEEVGACGVD